MERWRDQLKPANNKLNEEQKENLRANINEI